MPVTATCPPWTAPNSYRQCSRCVDIAFTFAWHVVRALGIPSLDTRSVPRTSLASNLPTKGLTRLFITRNKSFPPLRGCLLDSHLKSLIEKDCRRDPLKE